MSGIFNYLEGGGRAVPIISAVDGSDETQFGGATPTENLLKARDLITRQEALLVKSVGQMTVAVDMIDTLRAERTMLIAMVEKLSWLIAEAPVHPGITKAALDDAQALLERLVG